MARFKPNPGLVQELAREPWAHEMLDHNADAVLEQAQRHSPLGSDFVGYYGRFVKRIRRAGGRFTARSATVGNRDIAAHLVEWGSANNPPYAPLRRGVHAAGLRFAEAGRGADTGE